jgi:hypothetical protein
MILTMIRGLGEVKNNIIGEEQAGDKGKGKMLQLRAGWIIEREARTEDG